MTGEHLAELAETLLPRGRGGAGFPFGRKLRAVARRPSDAACAPSW